MEKEFVPYEESYQLKTLGFAEPCFAYYGEINGGEIELFLKRNFDTEAKYLLAPTFSQAFRWFRDNHGLYPSIEKFSEQWISRWCHINGSMGAISTHIKYEDAENACLRKLIELVKNK